MRKTVLLVLAMGLVPTCSFAVDGVVLINQSTVMAAGGFPYIIKDPGSYKLSGNLTMNTTLLGNYFAVWDIAIAIASSNVNLDLNGFAITVNNSDPNIGHNFYVIKETSNLSHISIRSGGITVNTPFLAGSGRYVGVDLLSSTYNVIEDLSVTNVDASSGNAMKTGQLSVYRRNRFKAGAPSILCPSLIVENVGIFPVPSPCVSWNNIF